MKRVFFNDVIQTMCREQAVAAVLVEDAVIFSTGKYQDSIQMAGCGADCSQMDYAC